MTRSPMQAIIDAMSDPVAVIDRSGCILAVNYAWRDMRVAAVDDIHNHGPGDNYLDASLAGHEGTTRTMLHEGVNRVLAGMRESYEGVYCAPGATQAFQVRIRRIDGYARFVVSHRAAGAAQGLEEQIVTAQMQERERVGADLHDSVGQSLVAIGLQLMRLRNALSTGGEAAAILNELSMSVQEAQSELRAIAYVLHLPWRLEQHPFDQVVRELVEGFARRAGLEASVELTDQLVDLSHAHRLTLFRILQEALVNVHRHARAQRVSIQLARSQRQVILIVQDDGGGLTSLDGAMPTLGVGLSSMRSRVRQFGGDLRIKNGPRGTMVLAILPIGSSEAVREPEWASRPASGEC